MSKSKEQIMKTLTKSLLVSSLGALSLSAQAVTMSTGGVTWEELPSDPGFNASLEFTQWFTTGNTSTRITQNGSLDVSNIVSPVTPGVAELVGVGEILSINSASFCGSCELTFSFGGIFGDNNGGLNFDQGWVNVYIDSNTASNFQNTTLRSQWDDVTGPTAALQNEINEAVNGDLWLSLSVADGVFTPTLGYVSGNLSINLEAEDGIALYNFNTDDVQGFDFFSTDLFDAVGSQMGASFTEIQNGVFISTTSTGSIIANPVSAPASLAIFGGALFMIGASVRRKVTK